MDRAARATAPPEKVRPGKTFRQLLDPVRPYDSVTGELKKPDVGRIETAESGDNPEPTG